MNGITFPVIGTTAHLLVTERRALGPANRLLRDFLADLDRSCSRFRPDSALSTLNRSGSMSPVDPLLLAALRVALLAAEESGGLVDPTLGRALIAIGYDRSFAGVARTSARRVTPVPGGVTWREITIDEPTGTVTLPRGVRLDLGATAKAWAADIAATQIAERLGCGALVNLGGDLAIAGPAPAGGWRVRVTADHAATTGGQVVSVRSGGLATSSTTVRRWKRADQVLHHVLDPATGLPARRVWEYISWPPRTASRPTPRPPRPWYSASGRRAGWPSVTWRRGWSLGRPRPHPWLSDQDRRLANGSRTVHSGGSVNTAAPLISESSYWYLTRASGFISLGLFSAAAALGLLTAGRVWSPRWPRFVTESLHRSVSLVAVCLVFVHVITILLDSYVKITIIDAIVPFGSAYLPLWVGLGAIAFDIIIVLILTSLLRTRLRRSWWKAVHWLAYLGWPVALAHTIGIGTDRLWVLGVVAASLLTVLLAGVYRVAGWRRVVVRRPL